MLGSLDDRRQREIAERFVDAWVRRDVDAVVAMLASDVVGVDAADAHLVPRA